MKDSSNRLQFVRTAIVALLVGGCVFTVAYLAAWRQLGGSPYVARYGVANLGRLSSVQDAVKQYRERTGRLPATLDELPSGAKSQHKVDNEGRLIDYWGNPINYVLTDDDFEIFSYGRDGQPGGRGMDADLYLGAENHPIRGSWQQCLPTLGQFAFDLNTKGMFGACVASGLLATLLFYGLSASHAETRISALTMVKNLIAVLIVSLLAATFLVLVCAPWKG